MRKSEGQLLDESFAWALKFLWIMINPGSVSKCEQGKGIVELKAEVVGTSKGFCVKVKRVANRNQPLRTRRGVGSR